MPIRKIFFIGEGRDDNLTYILYVTRFLLAYWSNCAETPKKFTFLARVIDDTCTSKLDYNYDFVHKSLH